MKNVPSTVQLPSGVPPSPYAQSLHRTLTDILGRHARALAAIPNVVGFGTTHPATNGAQGDFVWNSAPVETGTAGAKYVVIGWSCVATNTWVEARVLTGN